MTTHKEYSQEIKEFIKANYFDRNGILVELKNRLQSEFNFIISTEALRKYLIRNNLKKRVKKSYKISKEIENYIKENYVYSKYIVRDLQNSIKENFGVQINRETLKNFLCLNGLTKTSGCYYWHEKEIKVLNDYAGNIPLKELMNKVNSVNKNLGKIPRTEEAVKCKCKDLNLSINVDGNYYTKTALMDLLGMHHKKFERLLKEAKDVLKPKENGGRTIIRHENIRKFVVEYRNEISRGNPDLEWLLGLFEDKYIK